MTAFTLLLIIGLWFELSVMFALFIGPILKELGR
jgi:hypothetical protein